MTQPAPQEAAYQINGQPCSREAFYALACDPARNVAVQACAGAGKTWMLVSRILRILLDGMGEDGQLRHAPHEILAITFTKKAAGEMRERLHQWLQEFAHADDATLARELMARGISKEKALQPNENGRRQLSNLYQSVLQAERTVQIRTFHSWFAALLRAAPLSVLEQLQLPANYELLENDSEAVTLVWRQFYATLQRDKPLQEVYAQVVAAHGRFNTEKALSAALSKRVEFALADAHGVVQRSIQRFDQAFTEFAGLDAPLEMLSANRDHRQKLRDAAWLLGQSDTKTAQTQAVLLETALTNGDCTAAIAALLTQKNTPRKFSEKIAGIDHIRVAQDLCVRVVAAQEQHAAWLHQQCMAQLARALIECFSQLKRERGWVDMGDVERAALHLLSDDVLSGWVQQRLDAQIKHVLMDEFQDTNPLQWQALQAWLGGYAGAGGGSGKGAPSLFIVGDPKQSIYRFRRAEPQVFVAAMQFVQEAFDGAVLSCDHTRRNAPAVLDAVNAVMGAAQQTRGYQGFRPHTTQSHMQGAVICLPPIARMAKAEQGDPDGWRDSLITPREEPEEKLHNLECRQVTHFIAQQMAQGVACQNIMVLARKRDRLQCMRSELQALGIAAQIAEKTALIEHCEVQDIVALVDALVSPTHDLSLARALKSPLFGLRDSQLVQIAGIAQAQRCSWWHSLSKSELLAPELIGIRAHLLQYQGYCNSLPPHDALAAIYHHGQVIERFAAAAPASARASVIAHLNAVLAASLELDGGRFLTPYAWVRAFKAGGISAPAQAAQDAVRLLTVHGAKGLEAQVVILLDTDAKGARAQTMDVLVDWPAQRPAPDLFAFLTHEAHAPRCVQDALQREHAERTREETNALYVAMTRAQTTLVVSSVQPYAADPQSWWAQLVAHHPGVVKVEAAPPLAIASESAASETNLFHIQKMPQAQQKRAQAAIKNIAIQSEAAASSDAARIGQALHRLLEWHAPGLDTAGAMQAVALQFGLTAAQVQSAASMYAAIAQGEAAWAWDGSMVQWQGNEVELLHHGKLLRIDRLVQRRNSGVWWVLDYKSAHLPERDAGLRAQLREYADAVRATCPGGDVQAAFITGQGRLAPLQN